MKKSFSLLVIIVLLSIIFTACQTAAPTPEQIVETVIVEKEGEQVIVTQIVKETQVIEVEKEGPVTIGYAAPSLVGGQLDIQDYLVKAAQEKGWQVITTNANGDPQAQNDDIDYFISLGVDAIVTVPQDSTGICTAVEKANEASIPFFTIDRSPIGCKINMTVLSDNRMAGQQAGEALVELLTTRYGEPKGKVLEITGDLGQNVGQLRRDGFHDILDENPNIEVIQKVGSWEADLGQDILLDVLTANPDLDGLYVHSDNVYGPGSEAAMQQLGKLFMRDEESHIFFVSVDGGPWMLDAIRRGISDASGAQPVNDFGIVVDWIEKTLNGEAIEEGTVEKEGALWSPATIKVNEDGTYELFLATTLVTQENADDSALYGNQAPKE